MTELAVRPTEGAALLDGLARFLRRYVVMEDAQIAAVALWIVHTHAIDAAESTPFLFIASAEKRSGKTRLLDVLELLVPRPFRAVTPSEAAVFRKIATDSPTLLLDEVDALWSSKRDHEGLRALLNAGHRRGTTVPRVVGQGAAMHVIDFPSFCAKCLAGLGRLPTTVADRSVEIRLQRKRPGETVERFRFRNVAPEAARVRERIARFAEEHVDELSVARPAIPEELGDRASDGWEPLLAIADLAGGDWPERARLAAVRLSTGENREDESAGVLLLRDLRDIFDANETARMTTTAIISALVSIETSPWAEWRGGRPITPNGLASLLRAFRISPTTVRVGQTVARGYKRESFEDAFSRYAPPKAPSEPLQALHPSVHAGSSRVSEPLHEACGTADKPAANRHEHTDVTGVTFVTSFRGTTVSPTSSMAPIGPVT